MLKSVAHMQVSRAISGVLEGLQYPMGLSHMTKDLCPPGIGANSQVGVS